MSGHYDRVAAAIASGSTDELLDEAWAWAEHSCPATEADAIAPPALTTAEGVVFEAHVEGTAVGWKITDPASGLVEYLMLVPSHGHEVNPDNGAIADTFVLHTVGEVEAHQVVESGKPVTWVNHFDGAASTAD